MITTPIVRKVWFGVLEKGCQTCECVCVCMSVSLRYIFTVDLNAKYMQNAEKYFLSHNNTFKKIS